VRTRDNTDLKEIKYECVECEFNWLQVGGQQLVFVDMVMNLKAVQRAGSYFI
jgi:hypothetical protein